MSDQAKAVAAKQTPVHSSTKGSALQRAAVKAHQSLQPEINPSSKGHFEHDFSKVQIHHHAPSALQANLTIGQPGDQYEREADNVADTIMRMPASAGTAAQSIGSALMGELRRKPDDEEGKRKNPVMGGHESSEMPTKEIRKRDDEDEALQRKESGAASLATHAPGVPPIVHDVLHSSGQPLDTSTRGFMESRFNHDFSRVRVHTDERAAESARSLNALAYTVGHDVVFGPGQYLPMSTQGLRLIAHELTHVIQQGGIHQRTGETDKVVPVIQRQKGQSAIEVDILETPESKFSVEQLVQDNINLEIGMLINLSSALENFQTVVNASSKKEAIPKKVGEIAFEEVTKHVFKEFVDKAFGDVPGGKYVKEVIDLGKDILEAVDKEKARSEKATHEYDLAHFIVAQRTKISDMHSKLFKNSEHIKYEVKEAFNKKSPSQQKAYRQYLVIVNGVLARQAALATTEALFKKIAEKWIGGPSPTGSPTTSNSVEIHLDKDWKVISAYIHAPAGQRLAEQLLETEKGKVNLNEFHVPRIVCFYPEQGGLPELKVNINAAGSVVGGVTNTMGGDRYINTFIERLRHGLPVTSVLTGDTEGSEE
jgi:hypothetical protein